MSPLRIPLRAAVRTPARRSEAAVFGSVSLLLGYPDQALLDELAAVEAVAAESQVAGPPLRRFLGHVSSRSLADLAESYVHTFDLQRRCSLYLTYYTFGDTRKRGMALLRFADAYRRAGLPAPDGELPDHLAVVCNFAAIAPEPGRQLLVEHQAGIEALRFALDDEGSSYLHVVDALCAVLPEPAEPDLARALELARDGPPAETVGLEPFAPPEYMGGGPR